MNLHEFAALKPGDEIENAMTHSRGRVTEAKSDGVMVAWGGKALVTFHYSVNSTAWMHWSKVEPKPLSDVNAFNPEREYPGSYGKIAT